MTSAGQSAKIKYRLQYLPKRVLAPLPLPLLQPPLRRIVVNAALRHPGLFSRLGSHRKKRYLIDPVNMPFVFLLTPDPEHLQLLACRRSAVTTGHDARIAGTFLSLLDLLECRTDGDSLFFNRSLTVEGDTEAVVALRNALDSIDGNIVDDIASVFGFPARVLLAALRRIRKNSYAEN